MPWAMHVCSSEYSFALALALATVSLKNQFSRPTQNGRIAAYGAGSNRALTQRTASAARGYVSST